jgi:hypothetical protein
MTIITTPRRASIDVKRDVDAAASAVSRGAGTAAQVIFTPVSVAIPFIAARLGIVQKA